MYNCIRLHPGAASDLNRVQSDQNRNNAIRAKRPIVRRRHPQGLKTGLGEPENNVVSSKRLTPITFCQIQAPPLAKERPV